MTLVIQDNFLKYVDEIDGFEEEIELPCLCYGHGFTTSLFSYGVTKYETCDSHLCTFRSGCRCHRGIHVFDVDATARHGEQSGGTRRTAHPDLWAGHGLSDGKISEENLSNLVRFWPMARQALWCLLNTKVLRRKVLLV